ncbi:MAG TPA: 3-dehydroquinate synthase [Acidimicrobiia bacterium]|nr:3-dehydroquinate synthase [Acidimicrobiia bacterium]
MERVTVGLDPPYDVVVGAGAFAALTPLLAGRRRAAVVTQEAVPDAYRDAAVARIDAAGVDVETFTMGAGEADKSLATVERLCRDLVTWGALRGDVVVALGGGVVGDTAGFVAAVYHRGIALVQVPTTLLAMVDAAIGGKTAVNLPEGKNLVGAFHQPLGVVADLATLATLPEREYRAGLGEIVKYALMPGGEEIRERILEEPGAALARAPDWLEPVVAGCAAIKAEVVTGDPREESGLRATLNYGHTLAHALETAAGYDLLHGEAVAVGLVFAGHLATALERITPAQLDLHLELVSHLGLPTRVPSDTASASELLDLMRRDKKAHGGLTFVLLTADGTLTTVDDPPAPALAAAFRAVGVEG